MTYQCAHTHTPSKWGDAASSRQDRQVRIKVTSEWHPAHCLSRITQKKKKKTLNGLQIITQFSEVQCKCCQIVATQKKTLKLFMLINSPPIVTEDRNVTLKLLVNNSLGVDQQVSDSSKLTRHLKVKIRGSVCGTQVYLTIWYISTK